MRCRDAIQLIHEELDGTVSAESRRRLHEHLEACPACAQEYEAFARQEALLRELALEEPVPADFDALARSISHETRRRDRRPVGGLAPSWGLSTALAAACLLIGLSFGHVALPRTITRTQTVVQPMEVPGRVREVRVEKVVTRPVPVPVEVVRTRTVVRRAPAAPAPPRPVPALAVEERTAATEPAPVEPVLVAETRPSAAHLGLGAPPAATTSGSAYGAAFASYSTARISSTDLRLIASRLRSDMRDVDVALGTPTLAATLVSDMERAEAAMDRSLSAGPAAAATSSEDTR